jgi:hypothetical protein
MVVYRGRGDEPQGYATAGEVSVNDGFCGVETTIRKKSRFAEMDLDLMPTLSYCQRVPSSKGALMRRRGGETAGEPTARHVGTLPWASRQAARNGGLPRG